MRLRDLLGVALAFGIASCGDSGSSSRDASQSASTSTPARSKGCDDVPNASDLKKLLDAAVERSVRRHHLHVRGRRIAVLARAVSQHVP
ncbi:MAG: hypothetical protein DMF84_20330 [Acidobacteria bacterium]|nr:MAG: hypothetical protein DMF84_20330 [Acidobacteriota bacterium]